MMDRLRASILVRSYDKPQLEGDWLARRLQG